MIFWPNVSLFCLEKSRVSRAITKARDALMESFVPKYLGLNYINRESVIENHTTSMADTLFGCERKPCILVADGTYIYIHSKKC